MHEFVAMILQQLLKVTKYERRKLENKYHLGHGFFHRFIDEECVPNSRIPLDKVMLVFFDLEDIYDVRVEVFVHCHKENEAHRLLQEYNDFRESLRSKLKENLKEGVGLGRVLE